MLLIKATATFAELCCNASFLTFLCHSPCPGLLKHFTHPLRNAFTFHTATMDTILENLHLQVSYTLTYGPNPSKNCSSVASLL